MPQAAEQDQLLDALTNHQHAAALRTRENYTCAFSHLRKSAHAAPPPHIHPPETGQRGFVPRRLGHLQQFRNERAVIDEVLGPAAMVG
jgi:hypothetical protein